MLKLYNSLTNQKEIFKPISSDAVTIYSCGPTVYDHVHIGNLRAFILPDTLQRVLRHIEDKKVYWVMNITDVDDKMIKRSEQLYGDENPMQNLNKLADNYTDVFIDDIESVGIIRDDIARLPRATDFIDKMQSIIRDLLDRGMAYELDGSIYFSIKEYVNSGKKYGQLLNLDFDGKSRLTQDQDQKDGVADFALWKAKKDNEPYWNFEINGKDYSGRPGWHIECSAMSTDLLGKPFDIHTGGVDLKFPHHENEIAQCLGEQANYYLHNEHLRIESEKMSKSIGNIKKIDDIKNPMAFRYLVLNAHYRSQMDFGTDDLNAADDRIKKIKEYCDQLLYASDSQLPIKDSTDAVKRFNEKFTQSLEDDLNTPGALSALSYIEGKVFTQDALEAVKLFDSVMGLKLLDPRILTNEIKDLLEKYSLTRAEKDYDKSDSIRQKLVKEYSIAVHDTKYGTLISRLN